jgi:hypothetical protein
VSRIGSIEQFRQALAASSRWRVDNYLHPDLTGERLIVRTDTAGALFWAETDTGAALGTGWLDYPQPDEVVFRDGSVLFRHPAEPARVAFVWTLLEPAPQPT